MAKTVTTAPILPAAQIEEDLEGLYRALLLPRTIEQKMLRLIRQGRLAKWFSGYGQEAIAVGCAWALERDDYLLPMHRNLGLWTTRGVPLERLFCQLMGRAGGYTKGRDRTFHFGLPEYGIVGMISQLAAMLPVACGLGLASEMSGANRVALALTGEGATREGDFHEALSLAGVWKLPVIFVVENNGYGLSTPTHAAVPVEDLADAAAGYGMPGEVVDGNDVLAVVTAVRNAAARARRGEGPTLLEMKTFRMRGHEEASGTRYVPNELLEEWSEKDPIARFAEVAGSLDAADRERIVQEITDRVDRVAEWALTQPEITSTRSTELSDLFAVAPAIHVHDDGSRTERRFIDAISDGLASALEHDDRVLLMGQDIAEYGGVFKVTQGLLERFGPERVRNTPIIESGAVGAAMGLALAGYRPVLEIQYADFIACGFNQIVNNLATTHYRWGASLPVTIRAPFGGGIGAGPFHSQSTEAWFCHVPGLKVVIPSGPADAKGLLLSAIDDPNPVLFFEHKMLYRQLKGPVPDAAVRVPLGKAAIARGGKDATVVTYGVGVRWALDAAQAAAEKGYSVEVIDLRTLIPWDRGTVLASVRKTGRLLVLHEATRTAGFGAEVAASMCEEAFHLMDAAPVRIGGEDMPIPFASALEDGIYSGRARLQGALEQLLEY